MEITTILTLRSEHSLLQTVAIDFYSNDKTTHLQTLIQKLTNFVKQSPEYKDYQVLYINTTPLNAIPGAKLNSTLDEFLTDISHGLNTYDLAILQERTYEQVLAAIYSILEYKAFTPESFIRLDLLKTPTTQGSIAFMENIPVYYKPYKSKTTYLTNLAEVFANSETSLKNATIRTVGSIVLSRKIIAQDLILLLEPAIDYERQVIHKFTMIPASRVYRNQFQAMQIAQIQDVAQFKTEFPEADVIEFLPPIATFKATQVNLSSTTVLCIISDQQSNLEYTL